MAICFSAVVLEAAQQPVGGEDEQARILERHEQHQDVAVVALAADLVRVRAGGLVAVVAVGDQELGVREGGLERRDRVGVADPPERVAGAVRVGRLGERLVLHGLRERLARGAPGVGDRG